jgi:hypothetical protein
LHKIVPQVARVKFPVEKLSNIVACGDVEMYEAFGGDIPCEWTWSIRSSRRLKDEYARLALAKLEAAGMKPLIAIRFTEGSEGFSGKLFMEFAIQCPST